MSARVSRSIEINSVTNEISESDVTKSLEKYNDRRQFDRIHAKNLTYNDFFTKYLLSNVPVIIAGISDSWECLKWVRPHGEGPFECDINFEYLEDRIEADVRVPVANCRKEYFNSHEKLELGFHEYLDYWKSRVVRHESAEDDDKILYLKDWHLRRQLPQYKFYETPPYFGSDWLNEYCEEKGLDDYRFVYMGPKGTWTPFHVDVFSSFSWSTNIVGTKKWLFLFPGEELKLKDRLGNLPFSIDKIALTEKEANYVEVIQNAGETVFVPSGWYHQVWNLAETISVNHNWFNAGNVLTIWTEMETTFVKILEEISDCRDMEDFDDHCQLMLKSVFGINFEIFLDLLNVVVDNRIRVINSEGEADVVNDIEIGKNHALFDLNAIVLVLENVKRKCEHQKWLENVIGISGKIKKIMA